MAALLSAWAESTISCLPRQRSTLGAGDGPSQKILLRNEAVAAAGGRSRAQADDAGAVVERRLRPQGRHHRVPRRGMGGLRHLPRQSAAVSDLPDTILTMFEKVRDGTIPLQA